MILIVVLLAIGVVAITSGIITALNTDPGWQEVSVTAGERNCGNDFILQYHFSGGGATQENQVLVDVYNAASVKAYWLFTADEGSENYQNVYYINQHPGEVITLDPLLYNAFAKLQAQNNRYVYLGPACAQYNNLFFNPDDVQVFEQDPAVNEENRQYLAQIAGFASDPNHIQLKLLGNNQVKLELSQEYKRFAQDNEIVRFLDFGYMANAFIIDYFAEELIANGLTRCYISSVDGYTRNLWQGSEGFTMNIFDLVDNTIYPAGKMNYHGRMSIVALRNFPVSSASPYYREGANRTVLHPYLSLTDGRCTSSMNALLGSSDTASCADILMQLQPIFIAQSTEEAAITALAAQDISTVWCRNRVIYFNDPDLSFYDLFRGEGLAYQTSLVR